MVLVQIPRPLQRVSHNLLKDGFPGVIGVILLQEGNADVLQEQNLSAAVGGVFSGKDPEERSLSCAVRGNKGHLVPFIYIEVNSLEQDFWAITLGNVLYLQITWHRTQRYAIFGLILAMASKKEDSL